MRSALKHVARRHFFVREMEENGEIRTLAIDTSVNTADIFTKHLDHATFKKHRAVLLNLAA